MASQEDIRHLQEQVDTLTSRLDYIAPKMSLLSLTLQASQKVESEALLQLMRLKSAQEAAGIVQRRCDDSVAAAVDLAVWLQFATDLMLNLLSSSPPHTAADSPDKPNRERSLSPVAYAFMFSPKREVNPDSFSPRSASTATAARSPEFGAARQPEPSVGARSPEFGAARQQEATVGKGILQHGRQLETERPHGTPARHVPSNMDTTLDKIGMVLGSGAWANAYRLASGARRDALRMLGMTGIVTERELADDLTEIGEHHIEECICIATEMLAKWPVSSGPPPLREAKAFFETRLAELYVNRGPPADPP